eukprot:jgi/Chlat1/1215/Chrsp115S00746
MAAAAAAAVVGVAGGVLGGQRGVGHVAAERRLRDLPQRCVGGANAGRVAAFGRVRICVQAQAQAHAQAQAEKAAAVPAGRAQSDDSVPGVADFLNSLKFNKDGLVVAIAQHVDTGAILMQAFANKSAVSATLSSRRATFWSRSRASLWTKGETSDNFINVTEVYVDCDRDCIVYLGLPDGPSCHTGEDTCFFVRADAEVAALASTSTSSPSSTTTSTHEAAEPTQLRTTLYALEDTIASRRDEEAVEGKKPSWTKKLLQNPTLLCSKIREEAGELCETLEKDEGSDRAASEAADLLYHSMVLLSLQGVTMESVLAKLRERFAQSGIEEKAKRKQ